MEDFYRENVLDHARNPRSYGLVDPRTIDHMEDNPTCGDHIRLTLRLDENNIIEAVGWEGRGCAISQASASILYETLQGKSVDEVRQIDKDTLLDMLGITFTPARLKCALLSLKVLKAGVYGLSSWQDDEDDSPV